MLIGAPFGGVSLHGCFNGGPFNQTSGTCIYAIDPTFGLVEHVLGTKLVWGLTVTSLTASSLVDYFDQKICGV